MHAWPFFCDSSSPHKWPFVKENMIKLSHGPLHYIFIKSFTNYRICSLLFFSFCHCFFSCFFQINGLDFPCQPFATEQRSGKRKKSVRWEETENGYSKNGNIKECWKRLKTLFLGWKSSLENNKSNKLFFILQEHIFHPTHLLGNQEHSKRPASWPKTFFANLHFRECR